MQSRLAWFIAWRYLRSGRRGGFGSLVSLMAIGAMALGVFALLVVLSVMNGFETELRQRVLSVVPHAEIHGAQGAAVDWHALQSQIRQEPALLASAPFSGGKVLLRQRGQLLGAQLRGVDIPQELEVSPLFQRLSPSLLERLETTRYGIVLGEILAAQLGVQIGDSVQLILPRLERSPLGVFPRERRFEVVGTFSIGAQQDASLLFARLDDVQRLYRQPAAMSTGLRLRFAELEQAQSAVEHLRTRLPESVRITSWRESQQVLFNAVRMEKRMTAVLLALVIAVAGFNIVATLVMQVREKYAAIAVLRTLGATPAQIGLLFWALGSGLVGLGVVIGVTLGIPVALKIGVLVNWVEQLLGVSLFDPSVYFITHVPSVLQWGDLVAVVGFACVAGLLAVAYPAWRAMRVEPARALSGEVV